MLIKTPNKTKRTTTTMMEEMEVQVKVVISLPLTE